MDELQVSKKEQLAIKKEVIDGVVAKIKSFKEKGELILPANYVADNALKSAWLMLQDVEGKDKALALDICTKESIANSLLSMVVQGLNPDKKQCYFIVYGKKLAMQRSYFGSIAVAKSVKPDIEDIYGMAIYEGDEVEFKIVRGKRIITDHVQKLENIKKENVIGAYAVVAYKDGHDEYTVMTMEEIKQAWKQSKTYPIDDKGNIKLGSTHDKFTTDMAIKTVVNKACKPIINSSSDANIVGQFARQSDMEAHEAEVQEEIDVNANVELIDIEEDQEDVIEVVEDIKPNQKASKPVQEEIIIDDDAPSY